MRRSLATASMAAAVWAPSSNAQDITSASCVDGLFMLVARGTSEEAGPGITGVIAERIADRIDDSAIVAVDYPATITDPIYTVSVNNGTDLILAAVKSYAESCPDGKLAVFGYSQGAQITENAFCGASGGEDGGESEALPKDVVDGHGMYRCPVKVSKLRLNRLCVQSLASSSSATQATERMRPSMRAQAETMA